MREYEGWVIPLQGHYHFALYGQGDSVSLVEKENCVQY